MFLLGVAALYHHSNTHFILLFLSSDSGTIYARHSKSVQDLDAASRYITTFFSTRDFRATGVSIVTWEDVQMFRNQGFKEVSEK